MWLPLQLDLFGGRSADGHLYLFWYACLLALGERMLPGKRLTLALYGALAWIRDNTPSSAVIAVNNQWTDTTNRVPLAYQYSGFSERRVFLEGWLYSQRYLDEVDSNSAARPFNPFPERLDPMAGRRGG